MSSHLKKKLTQKNWEHADITKTLQALKQASKQQQASLRHAMILVSLLVMGVGNLLVSVLLVPLLLGLQGWFLFGIIVLLGIIMGTLFEILTRSIESLESEHHLLFSMIMPILALASVLFMSVFANDVAFSFGIRNVHNPFVVAFLYAIAFLAPYAYAKFILKKHYYS